MIISQMPWRYEMLKMNDKDIEVSRINLKTNN